jgi:hypothetical protein
MLRTWTLMQAWSCARRDARPVAEVLPVHRGFQAFLPVLVGAQVGAAPFLGKELLLNLNLDLRNPLRDQLLDAVLRPSRGHEGVLDIAELRHAGSDLLGTIFHSPAFEHHICRFGLQRFHL